MFLLAVGLGIFLLLRTVVWVMSIRLYVSSETLYVRPLRPLPGVMAE